MQAEVTTGELVKAEAMEGTTCKVAGVVKAEMTEVPKVGAVKVAAKVGVERVAGMGVVRTENGVVIPCCAYGPTRCVCWLFPNPSSGALPMPRWMP